MGAELGVSGKMHKSHGSGKHFSHGAFLWPEEEIEEMECRHRFDAKQGSQAVPQPIVRPGGPGDPGMRQASEEKHTGDDR